MLSRIRGSKLALSAVATLSAVLLLGGVALASGAAAPVADGFSSTWHAPDAAAAAIRNADKGRLSEILDKLVQQGVITRDQADKIAAAVHDAWPKAGRVAVKHDLQSAAAQLLGITSADLRKELAGKSLTQVAQAHGVARETLLQRLVAAVQTDIDKALSNKTITQEQADKLKANAPKMVAKAIDRVFAQPKSTAPRVKALAGDLTAAAAKAIGITPEQLRRELPGKSVAQVAQAHSVSLDAVVAALTKDANERIDAGVASGKITADQATRMRAAVPTTIAHFVERTFPSR